MGKSFALVAAALALVAGGFGLGSLVQPEKASAAVNAAGLRQDPPAGTRVALPDRDVFGQRLNLSRRKVLVILAGVCSDCSLQPLRHDALPYDRYDRILKVYESPADEVREIMEDTRSQHHPRLSVIADPESRLATALNAQWDGRWAVVERGLLVRLQKNPSDASF